ncbi:MAG: ATP:cob(I)alamin adenosyltransferase [Candidatus Marinimicrobia bacterium]|nr:ATP:cob(I)alamin adenosyltransferase [Candidatus Neomarinimicrobiota bacterium]|tara:strand:+ start:2915 stop:3463 length:549 start_codon:yes stop_codon:yes gene_type:complete
MGRISKVTTKTGDKGETGLGDGSRVSKSHPLIRLLGEIDELNSYLGRAIASCNKDTIIVELQSIQQDLFNMGGEVSMPKTEINLLTKDRISFLEDRIAKLNEQLPPLEEFILPGGDEFCSRIHVLRAVCRRVERYCVEVMEEGLKIRYWLLYLNRLSDYFFVLSRYYSLEDGEDEILWNRNK